MNTSPSLFFCWIGNPDIALPQRSVLCEPDFAQISRFRPQVENRACCCLVLCAEHIDIAGPVLIFLSPIQLAAPLEERVSSLGKQIGKYGAGQYTDPIGNDFLTNWAVAYIKCTGQPDWF